MSRVDHRNTKCCLCGGMETYIRSGGTPYWHGHSCDMANCTRYICHECYKQTMRNKTKDILKNRLEKRICAICGNNITRFYRGKPDWRRDKHRKNWDGKSYLCAKCDGIIRSNIPGSQKNIIKSLRDSRIGNLDKSVEHGKDIITQWIVARTLGVKDLNVENNNFKEGVDLSIHPSYGKIEVKSGGYNKLYKWWRVSIGNKRNFDNLIILCMDYLWSNIERLYIIPVDNINVVSITILRDFHGHYDIFRQDEKPFNYTFSTVDIPKKFSPFDLWEGKYNKIKNFHEK